VDPIIKLISSSSFNTTAAIDTFIVALQETLVELIIIMSQILPDKEMPF
jgi:hypothetical protein